jgi:hypothetical protein
LAGVLRIDNTAPQLRGCIFYGDRGDSTSATFLGIPGDEEKATDEHRRGCSAALENPNPSSGPFQDLFLKFRNFFPSDAKYPKATMLKLDGTVGVKVTGTDSYNSFFEYEIGRYADSEGSPEKLTLRPAFRGPTEQLLPEFNVANPKPIVLGAKGRVSFDVMNVGVPQLAYASYAIYGLDDQRVAGIFFPVFVPKR